MPKLDTVEDEAVVKEEAVEVFFEGRGLTINDPSKMT